MSKINTNKFKLILVMAIAFVFATSIQLLGLTQTSVYAETNCDDYSANTSAYSACMQAKQTSSSGETSEKSSVCEGRFLGFPTWYRGLVSESGNCNVNLLGSGTDGLSKSIWKIVLNVIEAAMMLVGYLSVIFIIYGGILFVTSAGSADGVKKAKSSITNAVIGLVISIVAIAVVEFIFNQLLMGAA